MKRFIAASCIWLLACAAYALTPAQQVILFTKKPAVVSGYTGPGDIVSGGFAWWGLRAYSSADRGNKLINLCEPTNTTCVDIASSASTGELVAPTNVGGTDCTAVNTCTIKTFYDRSGGTNCTTACDATQATAANRATLKWSCLNTLPCAVFNGTSAQYATPNLSVTQNQPLTLVVLSIRTSGPTAFQNILTYGNAVDFLAYRGAANTLVINYGAAGQFPTTVTDNNYHSLVFTINGASSVLMCGGSTGTICSVAGTDSTWSPGTNSLTSGTALFIGGQATPSSFLQGQFNEGGVWNSGFTAPNRTSMTANIHNFWGSY